MTQFSNGFTQTGNSLVNGVISSLHTSELRQLTRDAAFGAAALLRSWGFFAAGGGECGVSRLTLLVVAGRGAAGWRGRLVAAVGGVAVARLRAGAGAGGADVRYYASWGARGNRNKNVGGDDGAETLQRDGVL